MIKYYCFPIAGAPTLVDVNINIRSMGPISEIDMVSERLLKQRPLQLIASARCIIRRIYGQKLSHLQTPVHTSAHLLDRVRINYHQFAL